MTPGRPEPPQAIVEALRLACLPLPEVREQAAWTGVRWRVAGKTFAHVVMIEDRWPPAYAKAARTPGPACVLTFNSWAPQVDPETFTRPPFFKPPWRPDIVGLVLGDETDWEEVGKLVEGSYRMLAPKRLVERLAAP